MTKYPTSFSMESLLEDSSPVTVEPIDKDQGVLNRPTDYVPAGGWDRNPSEPDRSKQFAKAPVVNLKADFISGEEMEKLKKRLEHRIKERAKEIYKSYATALAQYKEARKLMLDATKEEMDNPDENLRAAIELVKAGKPITKSKAMAMAKEEIIAGGDQ